MIFDLACYMILLVLLVHLTRVSSPTRVVLKYSGEALPGTVLECKKGLMNRVGLLNTPALAKGDGLLLRGVKAVHTKGMHFAIDLVFLDRTNRVVGMLSEVEPGRTKILGPPGTRATLELGTGTLPTLLPSLALNQELEVTPWTRG